MPSREELLDMALSDITRQGVLEALWEYDRIGRASFLHKYGFRESKSYFLYYDGKRYDSKAIVGVAHQYSGSGLRPLKSSEFEGGKATVAKVLAALNFEVNSTDQPTARARSAMPASSQASPTALPRGNKQQESLTARSARDRFEPRVRQLLADMFSPDELYHFLRAHCGSRLTDALPGPHGASKEGYAALAAEKIFDRGLFTENFLNAWTAERENRADEIRALVKVSAAR